MINIFSDAACRNFGGIKEVNSYFVGSGLTYNLSSKDSCYLILESINKIDYTNSDNYLFFGEYDIRISLGMGNLPHTNRNMKFGNIKGRINKIISNYEYLINSLPSDFKIISPITSFPLMITPIEYFTNKLMTKYGSRFIDIFSPTIDSGFSRTIRSVKNEYKSEYYSNNPYICNTENISKLLCDKLNIEFESEVKGNMQFGTIYIQ